MKKPTKAGAARPATGGNESSTKIQRLCEELRQHPVLYPRIESLVELPVGKLLWTRGLEGYEAARLSAANALVRLQAETDAMQAGFESASPKLDSTLYRLGAGIIDANDPEVVDAFTLAQRLGKGADFAKRLAAKVQNASKRVPLVYPAPDGERLDGTEAADANPFRVFLAMKWLSVAFWLMSDETISRVLSALKLPPRPNSPTAICNRQTVTGAVKEMGLVKHAETLVKGIGAKGVFILKDGYLPRR